MSHESKSFTWTSPDGVAITLPSMKSIKSGVLRKHRRLEGIDAMYSIMEEVADAENLAKTDDLVGEELNALIEAWQEDAQTNVGESSGSSA